MHLFHTTLGKTLLAALLLLALVIGGTRLMGLFGRSETAMRLNQRWLVCTETGKPYLVDLANIRQFPAHSPHKAHMREVEKQKEEMIAAARAKISETEAKGLILARFQRLLSEQFEGYLRQYQRAFIAAVENLWDKYAVTTKQILAERDREAAQLNQYLKELGYE